MSIYGARLMLYIVLCTVHILVGICAPAVCIWSQIDVVHCTMYIVLCTMHIWSQIDGGNEGYAPVISLLYMCVWTHIIELHIKGYCLLSHMSIKIDI